MTVKRYLKLVVVAFILAGLLAGCAPAAPAAPQTPRPQTPAAPAVPAAPAAPATPKAPAGRAIETIRMFSSSAGSQTNLQSIGFSLMAQKYSPWLRVEVIPTRGVLEAVYLMLEGKGAVATGNAEHFSLIKAGERGFQALGPRPDVRLVQPLYVSGMHAVVLDKSPITAFTAAQLKGKTVVTREVGTITQEIAIALLRTLGLDEKKDVKMLYMGAGDAYSAVLAGQADISLQNHGFPYPFVEETFVVRPCRLVPIAPDVIEKANSMFNMTMGAGFIPVLYKGQKAPVPSTMLWGAAVSSSKIADDIIYELMRVWWGSDDRFEIHPMVKEITTDSLERYQKAGGIEFHAGSAKYFREKGWIK